ncbi:hypothetical protein IQ06DRAFT_382054 [Phaeosphaeriaceae sp. SRC1lsM3a]|nr:hypothetical protein IQ06DRAFT_382054 [Stagonospora sp. SRC1lsM3a]
MRSTTALLVLLANLFALTTAHRDWWLKGLPKCWQSCFADTEDGCSSSSCICNTSDDSPSYLPSAVSCAVNKCAADDWALELVLGPLDLLCRGIQCPIPKEVMDNAYAAASDDTSSETPSPPPAPKPTSKKPAHTSSAGDDAPQLTSTVRSTLTKTTTDNNGHTLQVIVPIALGPSGIVTGSMSTSTLSGRATTTGAPSSAITSPPAATSLPELSLLPSSTPPPSSNGGAAGGNGSPFDVSAAASLSVASAWLSGLGALAILCLAL